MAVALPNPEMDNEDDFPDLSDEEPEFDGRNLQATKEEYCNSWTNQDDCDNLSDMCSWCTPVDNKFRKNCHHIDNAKLFSSEVYQCSKVAPPTIADQDFEGDSQIDANPIFKQMRDAAYKEQDTYESTHRHSHRGHGFLYGLAKVFCIFAYLIVPLTMINHFWGFKQLIKFQSTLEDLKKKQEEEVFRISREEANGNFQQPAQPTQMEYIYDPIDVAISESILSASKINKIEK